MADAWIGFNAGTVSSKWDYHRRVYPGRKKRRVPPLGFLARLCPLKGLDILIDAFIILKKSSKHTDLRLEIAGGMTEEDEPFVQEQKNKLRKPGFLNAVHFNPILNAMKN